MAIRKRVNRSGEVRWDVRLYRPDGTRYSRSFRTRSEAVAYEREQMRNRDRGDWIDPAAGRVLVAEWADQWVERPGISPKTRHNYRSTLDRYVLPHLGRRPIGSITPLDVQGVINDLVRDGYAANTVRTAARIMSALFSAAVDADLIGRSPCRSLKTPPPPAPDEVGRALEPAEVWALAERIDQRYRALVLTGAFCGLRVAELCGLQVGDVDLLRRLLHVRRTVVDVEGRPVVKPPKSRAGRRSMSIPQVLADELAAHMARHGLTGADGDEWLFPSPTGLALRYSSLMRFWNRAVTAALEAGELSARCTPHDLRRTNATAMVAAGVDLKTAQVRFGHADPRLLFGVYARAVAESDQRAAEGLEDRFQRPERGEGRDVADRPGEGVL